jgi:hypothetical protein
MGKAQKIAQILKITLPEAVEYCEQVRRASGLGDHLGYQTILDYLHTQKHPFPNSHQLGDRLRRNKGTFLIPTRYQTDDQIKTTSQPDQQEQNKIRDPLYERVETYTPSHLPKDVERYSFQDYERVSHEKMEHCQHGVRVGEICAICNPQEFRLMSGID